MMLLASASRPEIAPAAHREDRGRPDDGTGRRGQAPSALFQARLPEARALLAEISQPASCPAARWGGGGKMTCCRRRVGPDRSTYALGGKVEAGGDICPNKETFNDCDPL